MTRDRRRRTFAAWTLLLFICCTVRAWGQEQKGDAGKAPAETGPSASDEKPIGPRPVRPEDYSRFESLGGVTLSPNGLWLAYEISRRDAGERELRLRMLATDSTETFEQGSGPEFSSDGKWLAFSIGLSEAEREKLEKAKKPVRDDLGLHSLVDGKTQELEAVSSFAFSDDGRFLMRRRYPSKERPEVADVIVHDLKSGQQTTFGNVAAATWSEIGALLALVIETADGSGNGLQVYDPERSTLRTLDSSECEYAALSWREEAFDLAVLRATAHEEDEDPTHDVLAWRQLREPRPQRFHLDPAKHRGFPEGMRSTDFAGLQWSESEEVLFFSIQKWENPPKKEDEEKEEGEGESKDSSPKKPAESGDAEPKDKATSKTLRGELEKEPAGVEVWHPKDIDIIPRQKRTLRGDQRDSMLVAWWLDSDRFVPLGNELTEEVDLLDGERRAIGLDNTPYEDEKRFGPTLWDLYRIDVRTGERELIRQRIKYRYGSGPGGRHYLYQARGQLWVFDVQRGEHHDLTSGIDSDFINQELSSLTDEKPAYGVAGWDRNGSHVYLYDRWDIWKIAADGSSHARLTTGADDRVRFRRLVLDPESDEWIKPDRPMYLSLYGDRTKRSGFARLLPGERAQILIERDAMVGGLRKARDADRFAFVIQRFDDSPDIFVAGPDLDEPLRTTETNPFQKDYLWGRSQLVDYENVHGEKLQGALFYPAGYDPGRKYPMIVYIYELRSQVLHGYVTPSERRPYNPSVFTSEGYFVFQPDIVYRPQNPGLSAVECVVPAVEKVLESGRIDPERVGLVGHSWGAYQTAFIVTQTDLFAAGVAGAPLTNMMSMSMSIYWNSGQTDAWIFHESQGRMDQPFWRDVETYIANSPIFNIDDLETPLLIAFGDEDGAVDWQQGIELYNAARLVQKPVVMLVYPGENHGLAEKPNQVDYHYRVRHWFDHYLKGVKAPKWITEGVSHLERTKELEKLKREKKDG